MKKHAGVGADILSSIDFPYPVVPIVRHHHENWDGSGYPDGLKGLDIPLGARILSVVDCFDALTSDRPYRPRLSDDEAIQILNERSGIMYDPTIVDIFVRVHDSLAPRDDATDGRQEALSAITESAQSPSSKAPTHVFLRDISASAEETSILRTLSRALNTDLTLVESGDSAVRHLKRILPFSLFTLYLYDIQVDALVVRYASGEHSDMIKGTRVELGQRLSGWVGANHTTILNSDPALDFGDFARQVEPNLRSCLSTPLLVEDRLVGVMSLYASRSDAYDEDHRRIAEAAAREIARSLSRSIKTSAPNWPTRERKGNPPSVH